MAIAFVYRKLRMSKTDRFHRLVQMKPENSSFQYSLLVEESADIFFYPSFWSFFKFLFPFPSAPIFKIGKYFETFIFILVAISE